MDCDCRLFKGLDYTWCRNPEVGLPRPDAVIFLSVSTEVAARRGGYGEERYEKEEMQKRVREAFRQLQEDPKDEGDWHVIDAGDDIETVAGKIWHLVQPVLETRKGDIRQIQ